jgi:hypothetical protein
MNKTTTVVVSALVCALGLCCAGVAQADTADQAFLSKMASNGIHSDNGDSGLIADALTACAELGNGKTLIDLSYAISNQQEAAIYDLYQGPDATTGTFLTGSQAADFVIAAHHAYCPQTSIGGR